MGQLNGKTAWITGASQGIGLATATRLATDGAYTFLTGRDHQKLDEAVASIGPNAQGIAGDVAKPADLETVADAIRARGNGLDIVFANAGGGALAALPDITEDQLRETFNTNVFGTIFTIQKALPLLNDRASIILTSSISAYNGTPYLSAYAATKAAIRSLGRTWAAELVDRGIRVNTVVPGSVATPGQQAALDTQPGLRADLLAAIPMGRLGQPDELASAVAFLASDDSSFMTGAELFVDGGQEQI